MLTSIWIDSEVRMCPYKKMHAAETRRILMSFVLERDEHSDEFKRAPLAEALSQAMLEHDRDRLPLNVGIFGAWGTGKTQFMKMVKAWLIPTRV